MRRPLVSAVTGAAAALVLAVCLSGCVFIGFSPFEDDTSTGDTSSDPGPDDASSEEDLTILDTYAVDADAGLSPQPDARAREVWDMFVKIVTPEVAGSTIWDFQVGDSDATDLQAYVVQTDDPSLWTLAANLAYADDPDLLLATLVHEYAHILSLSPGQTDPDASTCDTVELDEGCAEPSSAIWAFDQEFWSSYGSDAPDPANADADLAWEFYLANEEDFVSDYAATNVVEDFAESFMTFVLEPEPDGDSMTARKLLFFWDYPEYVAIREHVRSEFGL